jgi:hypothetical protein
MICAFLMLISIIAGWIFLEETHPDMQPWSTPRDLEETNAKTPLMPAQAGSTTEGADLTQESYGTFNSVSEEAVEEEVFVYADGTSRPSSVSSNVSANKVFTKPVIMLTIALGIFTYHSMTYDHLLPIFLQDARKSTNNEMVDLLSMASHDPTRWFAGGLGLSVKDSGIILSINGLIALFTQAVIFPMMASWLGIWRVFILVTIGHPLAYFVVPWLVFLPTNLLYPGILVSMAIRNFSAILAYPVLLILIKEASPSPLSLGKINGLAASTGAACRTIASPIAGFLYGLGLSIDFTALAWWASALVAVFGIVQALFIPHDHHGPQHRIRPATSFSNCDGRQHRASVVRIRVRSNDSGYTSEEECRPFASRVV